MGCQFADMATIDMSDRYKQQRLLSSTVEIPAGLTETLGDSPPPPFAWLFAFGDKNAGFFSATNRSFGNGGANIVLALAQAEKVVCISGC